MYHQLSRVTGRLVAATNLQSPLYPIAPIALQRVEPPQIQYNTAHMSTVTEASACAAPGPRKLIPGTNIPYPPVPEKIKKQQELFQKENDIPVFLKGGPFDTILYRFTLTLCVLGLAGIAQGVELSSGAAEEEHMTGEEHYQGVVMRWEAEQYFLQHQVEVVPVAAAVAVPDSPPEPAMVAVASVMGQAAYWVAASSASEVPT
ncbi:unnamed protein product, partial [Iphiclides podalirius]